MNRIIRYSTTFAACALMCVSLSNCIIIARTNEETTGKKLSDLKKALDNGAISKSEYQSQKAGILDKK